MTGDERLSAEHELVLNCCTPTYDSDAVARTFKLARRGFDWERAYEIARWHQVRPLLAERLAAEVPSSIPDNVRGKLREDRRAITQRNLLAADQLRTIIANLRDAGVRVIPFKGLATAIDVYDDISRREFSDIDLLVSRDDVSVAMDVLEACGYEWDYDVPRLDDGAVRGGRFTAPLTQEYRTVEPESGTMVELRWQVGESGNPFAIEFERLWRNATTLSFQGTDVRTLRPIDRLLVLTYHGTKHHWKRLKWLCDVAWLLQRIEVKWDVVLTRARRNETERRLLLGIGLARRLFDIELPGYVRERIDSDDDVSALIEQTLTRVFERPNPSIGYWELKRYVGRSSDSALGTVETLARSLLHPKMHEYEYYPLPARYHALYYLFRPFRVLLDLVRHRSESQKSI